jgi:hypothetical protein
MTYQQYLAHEDRLAKARSKYIQAGAETLKREGATPPGFLTSGTERNLHEAILEYCLSKRWLAVHSRMDRATTTARGVPDFLILLPKGRLLCVECKSRLGKATVEQLGWRLWAEKLGHQWVLVRDMAGFLEAVK